jgi:FkbM family methyltransferase
MIDFTGLVLESQKKIKGVIHIGAFDALERIKYKNLNVENIIWIEANPDYEDRLKEKVENDTVIIRGVGNKNEISKFNVANNGQSSSFLDFELHQQEHPNIFFETTIEIQMSRMVDIIKDYKINVDLYNYLSLDIQGYELEALKGFDNFLKKFDFIYTEVNEKELYKNCPLISEIDEYLNKFKFERKSTIITEHGWGDAFYIKNE